MDGNAAVEACVSAISQTVASLPLRHYRTTSKGGQEVVTDSPAARVLRKPNAYSTRADFVLNLLRTELLTGNGVAVAGRDDGGRIDSLHLAPPYSAHPYVAVDGSIFYAIKSADRLLPDPTVSDLFPGEHVLHLRMHTARSPLIGVSPITSAAMSIVAGNAVTGHMAAFFSNMTRPSGYLRTDKTMKKEVAEAARTSWESAYGNANSGKIAVLMEGLEWKPLTITSVDAQLIESYKMTIADVARVFRVPLPIIGDTSGASFNNAETLINHWLSTGLGYVLEHVELALDALFRLPEGEFVAFDTDALLRADFKTRIEGIVRGIQGGLYSPNEGRLREGLPAVPYGDEPRLQAQVVPLSFAKLIAASAAPSAPSAPAATPAKQVAASASTHAKQIAAPPAPAASHAPV